MFTFDKNRKEEKAVQTLLRLSECEDVENKLNCLVGASDISSFRNSASLRKKSKSDQSQNADFQLSPWEGPFAENTESRTSSISTLEQQQYTKKEQHKQSPKPRPEASTKHTAAVTRSVRFSKNQMAKDNALFLKDDENVKFYHLDDAHEYMTQYRETVTFSTMLEYRKSLVTSLPITLREKCEKSRSPYDLVKHCHCSGHSSISSSVCYTTECDAAFARQLLSVTSLARIKKKNDRNFSKNKQDKVEQKSGRKTSGSKLRMKGKMKRAASNYVKTNQYPRENIKNIRIKTGDESTNTLQIFSSTKQQRYSARMGANRPPVNETSEIKCGTPSAQLVSCLRPKVPQAAIPSRNTTFRACIMPMTVPMESRKTA